MDHDRLASIRWASIEDVPPALRERARAREPTTKYDVDGRRGGGG